MKCSSAVCDFSGENHWGISKFRSSLPRTSETGWLLRVKIFRGRLNRHYLTPRFAVSKSSCRLTSSIHRAPPLRDRILRDQTFPDDKKWIVMEMMAYYSGFVTGFEEIFPQSQFRELFHPISDISALFWIRCLAPSFRRSKSRSLIAKLAIGD
jgi:hypothetical protein